MGFGTYDESGRDEREYETTLDGSDGIATEENSHEGAVEYEFTASNDELLDRLADIKDEDDT